jgi:hypothetical protein
MSGLWDADDQYRFAATCINNPLENTMLQLILIGATLSYERPEPQVLASVPVDQVRLHLEAWRCTTGASAFWR